MKNSSEMKQFDKHLYAINIYSGLIEEIKKSDFLNAILGKEPWLKTAVNKWEDFTKVSIDVVKIIHVSENLTDDKVAVDKAREYLMNKLEIYLAEYRLKKAQFDYDRTITDIEESIFIVSGSPVMPEKFYLGGLLAGDKDPVKEELLYKELIDYTLALTGYEQKYVQMDLMSEMFNAPMVKEYIDDVEKEVKRLPEASLYTLVDSIMRDSNVAEKVANDLHMAKPIRHFARMVVDVKYCKSDCDNQDFSV